MGIFEFVVILVLIATVGEVVKARVSRPSAVLPPPVDSKHLEETVEILNQRVLRLEEERDFYRALLEPGESAQGGRPPLDRAPPDAPRSES